MTTAIVDDRWQPGTVSHPFGTVFGSALVAVAAFASLFRIGLPAAGDSLDGSWLTVLSWAFEHRAAFGTDIVFTYGPLGFLIPIANYYPATYSLFFVAQIFLGLVWAMMLARFSLRLGMTGQLLLALLVLAWSPVIIIDVGWYLMFALGAAFACEDSSQRSPSREAFWAVVMFALTVIALTKFTFLLLWFSLVGFQALQLLLARRPVAAVVMTSLALLILCGLWVATGQPVSGFANYFLRCLEISSGYNARLGYAPSPFVDIGGLAVLSATAVLVALGLVGQKRAIAHRLLSAFLLLELALTWKAGFIRADAHVCIFFGAASLIGFISLFVAPPRNGVNSWRVAAFASISVASLFSSYVLLGGVSATLRNTWQYASVSLQFLANPGGARAFLHSSWESGRLRYDLPRVRRAIGDSSVDLLMHEQGVLLLNGFTYFPRPVFQGYSASSTRLARMNEHRLITESSPRFLLLKLQAIDLNLPGSEDPLAQLAALRAYRPIELEKGYLLLERRGNVTPIRAPAIETWHEAAFGDEIAVPAGSPHILFYRFELSLAGKIYAALFREPVAGMDVITDSGVRMYRIARSLGDAGMLVSPELADTQAYLSWYAKRRESDVRGLRFMARAPGYASLFEPRIRYAFQSIDLPRVDFDDLPDAIRQGFYPGFSHMPRIERGPIASQVVSNLGRDVLFMHAPSEAEFLLPAGRWRVEGQFGLRADSYAPGVCPQSDGAVFRIYRGAVAEPEMLYSRAIDPLRVPADRGGIVFHLDSFDADGATPLTFKFEGGSSQTASTDCDWTFLGPLRFVPVEN